MRTVQIYCRLDCLLQILILCETQRSKGLLSPARRRGDRPACCLVDGCVLCRPFVDVWRRRVGLCYVENGDDNVDAAVCVVIGGDVKAGVGFNFLEIGQIQKTKQINRLNATPSVNRLNTTQSEHDLLRGQGHVHVAEVVPVRSVLLLLDRH